MFNHHKLFLGVFLCGKCFKLGVTHKKNIFRKSIKMKLEKAKQERKFNHYQKITFLKNSLTEEDLRKMIKCCNYKITNGLLSVNVKIPIDL